MMMLSSASLAFAAILFLLLGGVFIWCAAKMWKSSRSDVLISAPLLAEQEIRVPATGKARVMLEGPRTSADYREMGIELTEQQSGRPLSVGYSPITAQGAVYGVTKMQVPFGPPAVLQTGIYRARISGLDAAKDYSDYRLLISRPYLGRLTLQIITLVFCGAGMLLDLIWVAWQAGWMKPGTQFPHISVDMRRNNEISTALRDSQRLK